MAQGTVCADRVLGEIVTDGVHHIGILTCGVDGDGVGTCSGGHGGRSQGGQAAVRVDRVLRNVTGAGVSGIGIFGNFRAPAGYAAFASWYYEHAQKAVYHCLYLGDGYAIASIIINAYLNLLGPKKHKNGGLHFGYSDCSIQVAVSDGPGCWSLPGYPVDLRLHRLDVPCRIDGEIPDLCVGTDGDGLLVFKGSGGRRRAVDRIIYGGGLVGHEGDLQRSPDAARGNGDGCWRYGVERGAGNLPGVAGLEPRGVHHSYRVVVGGFRGETAVGVGCGDDTGSHPLANTSCHLGPVDPDGTGGSTGGICPSEGEFPSGGGISHRHRGRDRSEVDGERRVLAIRRAVVDLEDDGVGSAV